MSLDDAIPKSIEAERGVIGALLLHNPVMHEIALILEPEDFFRDSHATFYRAIKTLYDAGKKWDAVILPDAMGKEAYHEAGGDDALTEIMESTPHAANATYYAAIVREKSVKRKLIAAARETEAECRGDDTTADDAIQRAEERVFAISEAQAVGSTVAIGDLVSRALDRIEHRREGRHTGLSTGYHDLDSITDGLQPGQLVILAARPSMGKTALALNIAEHVTKNGEGLLFVSLEMSQDELAERMLIGLAGVDGHRVHTGRGLSPRDRDALRKASQAFPTFGHFLIDDSAVRTANQIAANARRQKARHGIGLVVIDYLQLVDAGEEVSRKANRQEQVASISRRVKSLARELKVPVLALSQLNRAVENRESREPRMADLRESGALEQDADMVLLLHRPAYYDPNDEPGIGYLNVAKNRNGQTGRLKLTFLSHLARFASFAEPITVVNGKGEQRVAF